MQKLCAIVGPTAVGKSELALAVASKINGEIVSCDSMQIYKGLDIGTGKVDRQAQKMIVHHMIDIVEIDEDYSVAQYAAQTRELIADINNRNKIPILVGGTGLFYQAVVDDYQFFPLAQHKKVRADLMEQISDNGLHWAYNKLKEVDLDYAGLISINDQKRIVRALEVYLITGVPFSKQQNKNSGRYNLFAVGLDMNRAALYQLINYRVDKMIASGFIDEVKHLLRKGYDFRYNAMQALGYKQILYYLFGFIDYDNLIETIKLETRRFAKRQLTWFRKDERIIWISIPESDHTLVLEKFLSLWEGQNKAT